MNRSSEVLSKNNNSDFSNTNINAIVNRTPSMSSNNISSNSMNVN